MHSHDGSLLLYIQPVWEAAAFPCNGFKHRFTPQRNGCTDRCTRPLESLNRCRGWPQSKRPEALLFAMFLTGPPSAAMQKRRLHTDGSDSGGEHIAKIAFLIRARSVVQVHPGPPFKSPINARRFSLSPSSGPVIKQPFCQKFAKSRVGHRSRNPWRSDARAA
jgi:hypothetical protein